MAATIFSANITGMQELKNFVAVSKLTKEVVAGVRAITNDLHTELAIGVKKRYALSKSLNSVLLNNGASIRIAGNVISATLAYKYVANDLSSFPYSPITVLERYAVHRVNVLRNQPKAVHGKSGHGGFVPKGARQLNPPGMPNKWAGIRRMYERQGKSRLPLRVLFGPSLSQMAGNVLLKNPTPSITAIVDNFDLLVTKKVSL